MAGATGAVFQGVRLFIEGVQIPFASISITQGIGTLPEATLMVPPQAFLMDIARFYQPKVHIFYEDRTGKYTTSGEDTDKEKQKLLFSGHISGVSYGKSLQGSGSVYIQFSCTHKNFLITECLVDYTGWLKQELNVAPDGSTVKDGLGNSNAAIIEALRGISSIGTGEVSENNPEGDVAVLPSRLKKFGGRYVGMVGLVANYWNQLNRAAYNAQAKSFHQGFINLYKPLIEDGLKFFERVAGHGIIETANQSSKQEACLKRGQAGAGKQIVVPPCNKLFLQSAVQTELTIESLRNYLQSSGEVTNIYAILSSVFDSMDYELITLASPSEVPLPVETLQAFFPSATTQDEVNQETTNSETKTYAIETIVKPKTPFYFSPACNVIYPHMYMDINVTYDEANIPTRVNMVNYEMPQGQSWGTHFRGPASVRKAIAEAAVNNNKDVVKNLFSTIASSYGAVGIYEQGRGVKVLASAFPRWLSYLSNSSYNVDNQGTFYYPDKNTPDQAADAQALEDLQTGWTKRYTEADDITMCPWAKESGAFPHHRILFAAADYYYATMFARSKAGAVTCLFNPYIVPGYPMDVLEKTPALPSFHGLCVSVTHTITESSATTQVQFAAANTYSELANYYIPFATPYLQVILGLAKSPTLVGADPEAITSAHQFYKDVLGVGAADPTMIYNFGEGRAAPVKINSNGELEPGTDESLSDTNGGELNPALSYEGNMALVYRAIENRKLVEERFGLKFVDLRPENYNPTAITYNDSVKTSDQQLEIGASQFLEYTTKFGIPINNG